MNSLLIVPTLCVLLANPILTMFFDTFCEDEHPLLERKDNFGFFLDKVKESKILLSRKQLLRKNRRNNRKNKRNNRKNNRNIKLL